MWNPMQNRIWSRWKQHPALSTKWAVVWIRGYLQRYVFEKFFFCCSFLAVVFFTHYMVGCADLILLTLCERKFKRLAATPTTLFPSFLKWKEDCYNRKSRVRFTRWTVSCKWIYKVRPWTTLRLSLSNFYEFLYLYRINQVNLPSI